MADRHAVVAQGPEGERGPRGRPGPDAYEVAVAAGFRGTRAAWIESLRGERGERGPVGPDGQRGERGLQGEPGPAAEPQLPIAATFERDDRHMTRRLLVEFPQSLVEIVPTAYDAEGFIHTVAITRLGATRT